MLPAVLGRVTVTRRWSVVPAVSVRFESATLLPISGDEASTVEVEPPHVYV